MNSPIAWALVFHVIGFVFWMGGLLVATQVLAAHTQESSGDALRVMERLETNLLNGVTHPGAAITVVAGVVVIMLQPNYLHQGWLHAKLFLVAILVGLDVIVVLRTKALQSGRVEVPRREFKILHGVISLIFLGIVILVMIKPF